MKIENDKTKIMQIYIIFVPKSTFNSFLIPPKIPSLSRGLHCMRSASTYVHMSVCLDYKQSIQTWSYVIWLVHIHTITYLDIMAYEGIFMVSHNSKNQLSPRKRKKKTLKILKKSIRNTFFLDSRSKKKIPHTCKRNKNIVFLEDSTHNLPFY